MITNVLAKKMCSLYTRVMKPDNIIDIHSLDPSIRVFLHYATEDNFTGMKVPGYLSHKAYLCEKGAIALKEIQNKLRKDGLELFIFDAYRPQKAVEFFHHWRKLECLGKKEKYFPHLSKEEIFKEGFIAKNSRHARASAVDLSLYSTRENKLLDMGTVFDYFGEASYTHTDLISQIQKENRLYLLKIMQDYGFSNFEKEWWHFNFDDEPYPQTYFDFDII